MITGIIMASGFASRMKKEKLLLEVNGISVLERVINSIKKSIVDEIILVCRKDQIVEIGRKHGIRTVINEKADNGQSESIKLGVKASSPKTSGFMFFVGDQPFLNSETINRLIEELEKGEDSIIIPLYNGKRGTPTIFSKELEERLLGLEGDVGGRTIIKDMWNKVATVDIEDEYIGFDIDTPEEYERLKE